MTPTSLPSSSTTGRDVRLRRSRRPADLIDRVVGSDGDRRGGHDVTHEHGCAPLWVMGGDADELDAALAHRRRRPGELHLFASVEGEGFVVRTVGCADDDEDRGAGLAASWPAMSPETTLTMSTTSTAREHPLGDPRRNSTVVRRSARGSVRLETGVVTSRVVHDMHRVQPSASSRGLRGGPPHGGGTRGRSGDSDEHGRVSRDARPSCRQVTRLVGEEPTPLSRRPLTWWWSCHESGTRPPWSEWPLVIAR